MHCIERRINFILLPFLLSSARSSCNKYSRISSSISPFFAPLNQVSPHDRSFLFRFSRIPNTLSSAPLVLHDLDNTRGRERARSVDSSFLGSVTRRNSLFIPVFPNESTYVVSRIHLRTFTAVNLFSLFSTKKNIYCLLQRFRCENLVHG